MRCTIALEDEGQGLAFKVTFAPGNKWNKKSPAHVYGRLLLDHLHAELAKRGSVMDYEDVNVLDEHGRKPHEREASPLILPPALRSH